MQRGFMKSIFRSLVVLSYVTYAVFFFIPYFDAYIYEQNTMLALTWNGYGAVIPFNTFSIYLMLAAYSVITIGLFFFYSWARLSFLVITAVSVALVGLQGIAVIPPMDGLLVYITNLIDGALIVFMYLTSISNRFKNNA